MSVLSAQSIRKHIRIDPFAERTHHECGASYGLSSAGYDIRIGDVDLHPKVIPGGQFWLAPGQFLLLSALEHIILPPNVNAEVKDKSTWARKGLALQNTVAEPGWRGHLTLELSNHSKAGIYLSLGYPIAQLVFNWLDETTEQPYEGKYQDQPARPVRAITDWQ